MNKEDFDFIVNDVPHWVRDYLKEGWTGRLSAHDLVGVIYEITFSSIVRLKDKLQIREADDLKKMDG